ncbi:MAG TPA: sugar transferase [Planctomycetota bacterium]|nr:sugar transferase [Planctomycetota bacterium]
MIGRIRHYRRVAAYHALELVAGAGAFVAAWLVRRHFAANFSESLPPLDQILWLIPVYLACWSAYTWGTGAYLAFRVKGSLSHAFNLAAVNALTAFSVFGLLMMLRVVNINRSLILFTAVANLAVLFSMRIMARTLLGYYTARGYDRHFALVVGTNPAALAVAASLEAVRGAVFQVRGLVAESPADAGKTFGDFRVLGSVRELPEIARREVVDEVFIVPSSMDLHEMHQEIRDLDSMGVVVHLSLPLFVELSSRLETTHVVDRPFLTFSSVPPSEAQLAVKRLLDVAASLFLLVILSPILFTVGLLVALTSKGGALFRQERVGMNGRRFVLYKFRTMVEGAERQRAGLESRNELDGPAFKMKSDPRVTGLGKILRKSSLDELPQLWNVLKGDMSLVGPRPLPDYEVDKFHPWQRRRMNMRPGITCLWQIGGRNETKFDEWMRLDLEYIDRWSLWLDLSILARTIPAVVRGRGAY